MSGKARIPVIGMIALLALVCLAVILYRSDGESALSRYKTELRARGEKLTIAEIAIPPSTNPLEIAARQILDSSPITASPNLLVNLMQFIAPGKARVAWRGELDLAGASGGTDAPARTWEEFIQQTENSEPSLNILRGALKNPPPDTGWVWKDDYQNLTNWPGRGSFARDRTVCQQFYNAVIADLYQGKLGPAIGNLHALAALAQMNRNEITLSSQMIRITIAQCGLGATWEALQAQGWDEPRLAVLQHDWERVGFIDGLERAFNQVRAFDEVLMAKVRGSSPRELGQLFSMYDISLKVTWTNSGGILRGIENSPWARELPVLGYKLTSVDSDELLQLQFSSGDLDAVRLVKSGRPWPEVQPGIARRCKELDEKLGHPGIVSYKLSCLVIPNLSKALQTEVQADTRRKLTITAIAIKRYQLKYGVAPPSLNALAPDFLAAVPMDPMSGKPLCYRLNADGTFVLYSTGEDGKDDGGDPTPYKADGKFGLWEGRDAVWPSAATMEEAAAWEARINNEMNTNQGTR